MMTLIEAANVIHYHRQRIGASMNDQFAALGWVDRSVQEKRFAALCAVGDVNQSTVLDLGCGYGDLKSYLDERFHGFSYIGVDCVPEFIIQAKQRHGNRPSCYFCIGDASKQDLPVVDYVFASGLLSYRVEDYRYYYDFIEKMYSSAKVALAFNMLDSATFSDAGFLRGHDPDQALGYCRSLAPRVELMNDYLANDFTIAMYRTA